MGFLLFTFAYLKYITLYMLKITAGWKSTMNDDRNEITQFYSGKLTDGYKFFGCQFDGGDAHFRVWAPRAKSVSVVGDFNKWDKTAHVMKCDEGIWHIKISSLKEFDCYKYLICTQDGREIHKADPYAFHSQTKGDSGSKIFNLNKLKWTDSAWRKKASGDINRPINIYEAHIGSWRKFADGNYFNYRKFADEICPYLKELNFTHLELMGIAEYPFDGSWGYQITGYFAPTSRYGTPDDFAYLVNKLHLNNIGVIMDWVPGHFPKDEQGLYEFDGFPLYEPEDELKKEHKEWGTRCFDYARNEVKSFFISNALYWIKEFHIDGLRVDAVASMLYLDYGRREWRPNRYGGNENLEAIEFLRQLNNAVHNEFPYTLMIAEESTAWPLVTRPPEVGGLGFNYKWNMGWMNDTLSYAKTDPLFRKGLHNNMTFSMTYAYSENYILPISHDEIVHGKGSLVNKMPGECEQKFAGLRNYLMNMYAHPGKKLLFMGSEFGQVAEWKFADELDWHLLEISQHYEAAKFFKTLSGIYCSYPALYEIEDDWKGFEWLVADDSNNNVIIFQRIDKSGASMIVAINFSPVEIKDYCFGADAGSYTEILKSDISGWSAGGAVHKTQKLASHNKKNSITMNIAPMSGVYMICKQKVHTQNGKKSVQASENNQKPDKSRKKSVQAVNGNEKTTKIGKSTKKSGQAAK